ncbi:PAS domain-containing protein [Candidatus Sumerlaeota bacterium]|nr:PAS domain-containing protein [Candidatus Sumerlaeota bacterium]
MAETPQDDRIARLIAAMRTAMESDLSAHVDPAGEDNAIEALSKTVDSLIEFAGVRAAETKRVQKELDDLDRKYWRLHKNIFGVVFTLVVHPDGVYKFSYVNEASLGMFEIDPTRVMEDASSLFDLIHPDDRPAIDESIRRSARDLTPLFTQMRGSVRGKTRHFDCVARPEGQADGSVLLDGIILETTRRTVAEESLSMERFLMKTLMDTTPDHIYFKDKDSRFIRISQAHAARFGLAGPSEAIGRTDFDFFSEEHARQAYDDEQDIIATGVPLVGVEEKETWPDGHETWVSTTKIPLKDSDGNTVGILGISRDVTERKRAEEEKTKIEARLAHSQRMECIGQLAGGVAHDFNNMLSVILGYCELLASRLGEDNPLRNDVREIEKAATRSRDITHQLLAFSRKQIIVPKPVNLNNLIADMTITLARLIGEDIDLRFLPQKDLGLTDLDNSQFDQILMNLAVNSRDAMPDGGLLTIETSNIDIDEGFCHSHPDFSPGQYVRLTVSDSGVGMNRETMSHLFEPFFTTKEVGRGTGLGLATVYGIVKQNGGVVNVYSEPDRGTTFRLYFPRIYAGEEALEAIETPLVVSDSGTILLVEDDEMVRGLTAKMLESIGYTVRVAGDAHEALSFCEEHDVPIDLLLTDVVMPGMKGDELSNRAIAVRPELPVLFMSGHTSEMIVNHGVLEENLHFIQKPFTLRDLAHKIREAIRGGHRGSPPEKPPERDSSISRSARLDGRV